MKQLFQRARPTADVGKRASADDIDAYFAGPGGADLYCDAVDPEPGRLPRTRFLPGLALAAIASMAAAYLSDHYGAPLMLMGLLIGLAFNFSNSDARLHPGLAFASVTLLRCGIVLVGLQVTVQQIAGLGWTTFAGVATMVVAVTLAGVTAARLMGRDAAFGTLAGGAVAICGASAALALASVLGEKRVSKAELTLVLVAVSAASAIALSFYPLLAHLLRLSDQQAGFLMGASIHDVAQALGAGYSYSAEAGQTATIVKLSRVALLAPTLAVVAYAHNGRGRSSRRSVGIPWFVLGFLALCALHSFVPLPAQVFSIAKPVATTLLLLAITSIGIRSPMRLLMAQGWRPFVPVVVATIASFALALGVTVIFL